MSRSRRAARSADWEWSRLSRGSATPGPAPSAGCEDGATRTSRRQPGRSPAGFTDSALNRVGGDFAAAPSHTTGRASLHPAVRRRMGCWLVPSPASLGIHSSSAGEGSALWLFPGGFTAFAQPAVSSSEEFGLLRLSHEPLEFLPSSTFGPSRCHRIGTMTSADSCRLSPTSRPGLLSYDRLAAGLPR